MKMEDGGQMKKLRDRNAFLESEVLRLQSELSNEKAAVEVKVSKKELELKIEMTEKVKEAYDDGYKRCQEQMELLAKLKA